MQGKNGVAHSIDEATVTQVAAEYIAATLGASYAIHSIESQDTRWWVRIQCHHPNRDVSYMVGHLTIDRQSGVVTPFTQSEIIDIQQRAALLDAHNRRELARDSRGFILPLQAKVKVNGYMSEHVVFFAMAEDQPQWIDSTPPRWRVATALWLHGQKVCDLGFINVNALTGEVIALSENEITARQKRARHAAEAVTSSAATTS